MKFLKIYTRDYKDKLIIKYFIGFVQVKYQTFFTELHRDKIKRYYRDKKGYRKYYWVKRKGYFVYSKNKKIYYKTITKKQRQRMKSIIKSEARLFSIEEKIYETWKEKLQDGILYAFRKHVSVEIFRDAMINNFGLEELEKLIWSMVKKMKILYNLKGKIRLRGVFVVEYLITTRYDDFAKMTHFVGHKKYKGITKRGIRSLVDDIVKNLMTTNSIFVITIRRIDLFILKSFTDIKLEKEKKDKKKNVS